MVKKKEEPDTTLSVEDIMDNKLATYKRQMSRFESEIEDYKTLIQHKEKSIEFIKEKIKKLEEKIGKGD